MNDDTICVGAVAGLPWRAPPKGGDLSVSFQPPQSIAAIAEWPEQAALFVRAVEAVKPKQGFRARNVEDLIKAIDQYRVAHNLVLVMTYLHSGHSSSGRIIMPDATRDEDRYQGKVGLVVKKGPLAYRNDGVTDFGLQDVRLGEWVVYRASDGYPIEIAGVHFRMLEDTHIKGSVERPDTVY